MGKESFMKKIPLLLVVGLAFGGVAFALEDRGAIGLGITVQSSQTGSVTSNLRLKVFFDVGTRLLGSVYYGFELEADGSRLDEHSFAVTETDVSNYNLGGGNWEAFYPTSHYQQTYTLWDFDISPRVYLSLDLGTRVQLLGFVGINYNWQTLDYTITNTDPDNAMVDHNGAILGPGQSSSTSTSLPITWATATGLRLSIALIYLEYTHYFVLNSAAIDLDNFDVDRLGLGVSLRF